MAKRREVSFEVHVKQKGRWQIQARYAEHRKDAAVEDAHMLDRQPGLEGVRIIRESYYPERGISRERIIYQSSRLKGKEPPIGSLLRPVRTEDSNAGLRPSRASDLGRTGDLVDDFDFDAFDAELSGKKKRKRKRRIRIRRPDRAKMSSAVVVVVKILLAVLFSVGLATALMVLVSAMLSGTELSRNAQQNMLFAIFVGTFLVSASYFCHSILTRSNFRRQRRQKAAPARRRQVIGNAAVPAGDSAASIQPSEESFTAEQVPDADGAGDGAAEPPQGADAAEDPDREATSAEGSDQQEPAEEADPDAPPDEAEETPAPPSPEFEKQKKVMLTFLAEALQSLGADQQQMDSFNKFGVNLFMAGGTDSLAHERNLQADSAVSLLAACVGLLGFKEADAAKFAGKYEEYLLQDSRYMQMFQAGRIAMNGYLSGETASIHDLEKALIEWNKPKPKEERSGPITVMFTDIAGSTALTQSLGDEAAHQVVRTHNRIVRETLNEFTGREVKHTGDGIMASFDTTSNAVEAAAAIQTRIKAHNRASPNLPIQLKIGINAGEPIAEDDDLFGTTVQLAARIVDKTQPGKIFVSEIVRGICAGKNVRFTNAGQFSMKGFDDALTLYEVVWDDENVATDQPRPRDDPALTKNP